MNKKLGKQSKIWEKTCWYLCVKSIGIIHLLSLCQSVWKVLELYQDVCHASGRALLTPLAWERNNGIQSGVVPHPNQPPPHIDMYTCMDMHTHTHTHTLTCTSKLAAQEYHIKNNKKKKHHLCKHEKANPSLCLLPMGYRNPRGSPLLGLSVTAAYFSICKKEEYRGFQAVNHLSTYPIRMS